MMPTLRQIKRLSHLLMDLHMQHISPGTVCFVEKNNKPLVIIESQLSIKKLVYYISWKGELSEES